MEEKKLTDEEIVKALECTAGIMQVDCDNCPFLINKFCDDTELATATLDLINRQKAEIERLTKTLDVCCEQLYHSCMDKGELQKQVDELTEGKRKLEGLSLRLMNCDLYQKAAKDTAKEIYEKAKAKSIPTFVNIDDNPRKDSSIFLSDLKNIVREKGVEVE